MKSTTVSRTAACIKCGKEFTKKNICKPNKFCSITCRRSKKITFKTCTYCGNTFQVKYPRNPNIFCGRSCQGSHYLLYVETAEKKASRQQNVAISNTMRLKGTKSPASSKRMKERNPMYNPEYLAKMTATIRAKKTWLGERGGNGFITQPQLLLAETLFLEEFMEHSISMKTARKYFKSLPTHYCVDLAIPELKIAIEVDGHSHKTRKWRFLDRRKTEVLNFLGWVVLRFWNHEVLEDLQGCVATVKHQMLLRLEEVTVYGTFQPIPRSYTAANPPLTSHGKGLLELPSPINALPYAVSVSRGLAGTVLDERAAIENVELATGLARHRPFEYHRDYPKPRRITAMENAGQLSLF